MSENIIATIVTIIATLGGWDTIKYFLHRKSNAKKVEADAEKAIAEADNAEALANQSEFNVLKDTMIFLQTQLKEKEERFANQTDLVRKLNIENLELTRRVTMLEAERSMKLCERRGCKDREPQSGY